MQIKIRVWDKDSETMIYGVGITPESDGGIPYQIPVNAHDFDQFDYYPNSIIMLYTGLKDKNGTEIYESDVVYVTPLLVENNPSFRAIVEWGVSGFVIRRISNFTDGFYMYPVIMDLNPMAFSFEVIGNIYEHPHLLGGEEE